MLCLGKIIPIRCVMRFILRDLWSAFHSQHQWENCLKLNPQYFSYVIRRIPLFYFFLKKEAKERDLADKNGKGTLTIFLIFLSNEKQRALHLNPDLMNETGVCSLCCWAVSPVSLCHDLCFASVCGKLWYDTSSSKSFLLGSGLLHGLNLVLFSPGGLRT